ncbi:TonB-dependent receptor [Emcibacter sp. SYSU 3D8]|uniref:TonB-dependent receptor n=1 Tax=Emcibacter sp. SYSU 3D8 TaxID=3133969 RepID=UPI0031FE5C8E
MKLYGRRPSGRPFVPARGLLLSAAVISIIGVDAMPAFATESVTVTARKREEDVQDVPVAIQAFTSADVEKYRSIDLSKIGEMATQVILVPAGSGAGASFHIRGLGSSSGDPGIDSSVTVNLDGMQINRGHIIRAGLFDVASVEVLKGPQALFFGKNSPAGVISLSSNGPTDEWEFTGRLSYEIEADEFIGEAIASGPINDKVGLRVAYRGRTQKGWLKNVAGPISAPLPYTAGYGYANEPYDFPGTTDPRRGSQDEHMGRITLAVTPSDSFDATLKVLGAKYKDDGASTNENISCSGPKPITIPLLSGLTLTDPYGDCELNGVMSQGELPAEIRDGYEGTEKKGGRSYTTVDTLLTTLNMNWKTDKFTLTSQTGIYYYDYVRWDNFDGTSFIQFMGIQLEKSVTWSQEFRFLSEFDGPVNFMFGVFYENLDRDSDNRGKIAALGIDPVTGNTNNWGGESTVKGDTYSAFGQAIWKIVPEVELAGGARWTKEKKTSMQVNTYVNPLMEFFFGNPAAPFMKGENDPIFSDFKDSDISPEVTLTWTPMDELTLYGAYKTGYKSGGFSTNTVIAWNADSDSVRFDSESSEGFEVGLKSMLLDGAMRFNLTGYRYSFSNLQVSAFDSATTSFQIRNAASARTTGIEADMNYMVTPGLVLKASAGYNRARYSAFPGAPCYRGQSAAAGCVGGVQDLTGRPLVFAPDWSGSLGFTYDTPIFNGWNLGLTGDLVFSSGYYTSLADDDRARQDSFQKVNASIRLYSDDERWDFAVIGRNLGNKRTLGGTADKPGGLSGDIFGNSLRAREITFQVTSHF